MGVRDTSRWGRVAGSGQGGAGSRGSWESGESTIEGSGSRGGETWAGVDWESGESGTRAGGRLGARDSGGQSDWEPGVGRAIGPGQAEGGVRPDRSGQETGGARVRAGKGFSKNWELLRNISVYVSFWHFWNSHLTSLYAPQHASRASN